MQNLTPCVLQLLPALNSGGIERGTIDVAAFLSQKGLPNYIASKGGMLTKQLLPQTTHIYANHKHYNPYAFYKALTALSAQIKNTPINLIHGRSRLPGLMGYFLAKKHGLPYVSTYHSYHPHKHFLKRCYNRTALLGDHIIAVSDFIKAHLIEAYAIAPERITVIHRGVDLEHFAPRHISNEAKTAYKNKWALPKDKKILIYPGRISRRKGYLFFLDVLKQLPQEIWKEWHVLFVGAGNNLSSGFAAKVKSAFESSPLQNHVTFTGVETNMPLAYAVADLGITCPHPAEAFGRVNAEMAAMGLPVLSSATGGALEIIKNKKSGWLYTPLDQNECAENLMEALTLSPETRFEMGQKGMAHVRKNFSLEKMLSQTFTLYKTLLEQKCAS